MMLLKNIKSNGTVLRTSYDFEEHFQDGFYFVEMSVKFSVEKKESTRHIFEFFTSRIFFQRNALSFLQRFKNETSVLEVGF